MRGAESKDIKRIVNLLFDARVFLQCVHSAGSEVPLLGQVKYKIFRAYFLDVGLLNALYGLSMESIDDGFKNKFNTKGIIAEQYVAQHLQLFKGLSEEPKLFYHLREEASKNAEIDFLIEEGNHIYPIEVKAKKKGHLKSLKAFFRKK